MEVAGHQDHLKRSSLGRIGKVGELYDVRSECLSSLSLMKSNFRDDLIHRTDVHQTLFEYKFMEKLSDRFELIDVEAELQLSILLGLIKLEGSGKFLDHEKKSEKTISCSVACQLRTVHEKLFASFDEIVQNIDMNCLENPQYTHVITEINWGANCLMNLEFSCNSDCHKEEIRGRLAAEFTKFKLLTVSGKGKLEKEKSDLLSGQDMHIKVFADVVPEESWPLTVEGFFEFVGNVPKLLSKVNNGKGKPLNYTMIPLSIVRKLANLEIGFDVLVRRIDESFLTSTIYLFEEIGQTKRKLYDLYEFLNENRNYVMEEDLRGAANAREELSIKESELKLLISEQWMLVKSGEISLKEVIVLIEKFKNRNLNLFSYESYLESCLPILQKVSTVRKYTSEGIIYLGKGETFQDLQFKHPIDEFIVLVTSTEIEMANPELNRKTHLYFVTLAADKKPGTKYVVVDFDFAGDSEFLNSQITETRCFHLKGMKVLSRDLFAGYIREMETNYARPRQNAVVELCDHKPGNRVELEMVCPGVQAGTCPNHALTWFCFVCHMKLEYGFDENFYCGCGKKPATVFEYRCCESSHGAVFIPASGQFLESALSKLRPLKEMNVLVIGQSGVGKSTWINSIINYLTYDSLVSAEKHGVICTIPASFTIYDPETFKKHKINVGPENGNEVTDGWQSATQCARTYAFQWEDTCVRIIDTPGLGDTRGIDQDKENLNSIICHLGYLKEIHGVCILIKANDNRFNTIFTYCIKELLTHLHKSVTRNIVFCFTNSRNSLYSPGQASVVLEKLVQSVGIEKELQLGRHNMFTLDNEAFMFLCSLEHTNIQYKDVVKASFVESWKISMSETERLFRTVKNFKPHLLEETISLVTSRSRVLSLTKPLAEVSKTILLNVSSVERKKKEVEGSEMSIKDLEKKLHIIDIELEPVALPRPRTVCTSSKCVEYLTFQGLDVTEIEYKTHCHRECYLEKVTPKTVKNVLLKGCSAMENGVCIVCGCSWDVHMHLTYSQKRVEKVRENKNVKADMQKEMDHHKTKEELLKFFQDLVDKYKSEEQEILKASVKFGMFLRSNSITAYNDSVSDYLEYLISEEEKKPYKSETEEEILKSLRNTLDCYHAEVKVLQEVMRKSEGETGNITAAEIYELEKHLCGLELMGKSIRESINESRKSNRRMTEYSEVPVYIPKYSGEKQKTPPQRKKIKNMIEVCYKNFPSLRGKVNLSWLQFN